MSSQFLLCIQMVKCISEMHGAHLKDSTSCQICVKYLDLSLKTHWLLTKLTGITGSHRIIPDFSKFVSILVAKTLTDGTEHFEFALMS